MHTVAFNTVCVSKNPTWTNELDSILQQSIDITKHRREQWTLTDSLRQYVQYTRLDLMCYQSDDYTPLTIEANYGYLACGVTNITKTHTF